MSFTPYGNKGSSINRLFSFPALLVTIRPEASGQAKYIVSHPEIPYAQLMKWDQMQLWEAFVLLRDYGTHAAEGTAANEAHAIPPRTALPAPVSGPSAAVKAALQQNAAAPRGGAQAEDKEGHSTGLPGAEGTGELLGGLRAHFYQT